MILDSELVVQGIYYKLCSGLDYLVLVPREKVRCFSGRRRTVRRETSCKGGFIWLELLVLCR